MRYRFALNITCYKTNLLSILLTISAILLLNSNYKAVATISEFTSWNSIQFFNKIENFIFNRIDNTIVLTADRNILKFSENLKKIQSFNLSEKIPDLFENTLLFDIEGIGIATCWNLKTLSQNNTHHKCLIHSANKINIFHDLRWNILMPKNHPKVNAILTDTRPDSDIIIYSDRYYNRTLKRIEFINNFDGISRYRITHSTHNSHELTQASQIQQKKRLKNKFLTFKYILSFLFDDYIFFVFNDVYIDFNNQVVSEPKLARICKNDSGLVSYVELPIVCDPDIILPIKAAFYHITSSSNTSNLYIIFEDDGENPNNRDKSIRLCTYAIDILQNHFDLAVRTCNRDGLSSLLNKISSEPEESRQCQRNTNEDWCSSRLNPYINGSQFPIDYSSMEEIKDMTDLSFIYVETQGKSDVVFLGTQDGQITKFDHKRMLYTLDIFNNKIFYYGLGERFERSQKSDEKLINSVYDQKHHYIALSTSNDRLFRISTTSCGYYVSCKECLNAQKIDPLDCVWCQDRCSPKNQCSNHTHNSCPPKIVDFYPKIGPLTGNTKLTIRGENLGRSNSSTTIFLGSDKCDILQISSEIIICNTKPVKIPLASSLNLNVNLEADLDTLIAEKGSAKSSHPYFYAVPSILNYEPNYGPLTGGINVTFYGDNLNIGSERNISFGESICEIVKESTNELTCRSNPAQPYLISNVDVVYKVDGSIQKTVSKKFEYRQSPKIISISPLSININSNQVLNVIGTGFESIFAPKIKYFIDQFEILQNCTAQTDGFLECHLPLLNKNISMKTSFENPLKVRFSLILDGLRAMNDYLSVNSMSDAFINLIPESNIKSYSLITYDNEFTELLIIGEKFSEDSQLDVVLQESNNTLCLLQYLTPSKLKCKIKTQLISGQPKYILIDGLRMLLDIRQVDVEALNDTSVANKPVVKIVFSILVGLILITTIYLLLSGNKKLFKLGKMSSLVNSAGLKENSEDKNKTNLALQVSFNKSKSNESDVTIMRADRLDVNRSLINNLVDEETLNELIDEKILINRNTLTLGPVLGSGQFGRVYKGFLRIEESDKPITVAVKTLHSRTSWYDGSGNSEFLREGLMMKDFQHRNVLPLIGVTFDSSGLPMVITPFMLYGDLKSYISDEAVVPSVRELIEFGIQIAHGMSYLSSLRFVHRDLAARNCMLDSDFVVKVADFGLSRDIYEADYYSSDDRAVRPVRWMSIESLERNVFSTKSDVWAYGIVLWELLTRGGLPYPGVDNYDIVNYLKSGRRMSKPDYCPKILYEVMMACWNDNPKERPTFDELIVMVSSVVPKLTAPGQILNI